MNKWHNELHQIRGMAGNVPTEEIALTIGTSVGNLYKICHRNNITLPRDPSTNTGGRKRKPLDRLLAAEKLLLSAGYRVFQPDPFAQ